MFTSNIRTGKCDLGGIKLYMAVETRWLSLCLNSNVYFQGKIA